MIALYLILTTVLVLLAGALHDVIQTLREDRDWRKLLADPVYEDTP